MKVHHKSSIIKTHAKAAAYRWRIVDYSKAANQNASATDILSMDKSNSVVGNKVSSLSHRAQLNEAVKDKTQVYGI